MTNEMESKRIGERITALRKEKKMTQEELAIAAGLQRTHILRIEQGRYDVRLSVLSAIAGALCYTVDFVRE